MTTATAIAATTRTAFGRRANTAFRKGGQVPAVILRSGSPSVHILINEHVANQLLKSRTHTATVAVDGVDTTVLIQDASRDCLNDRLLHIDFLEVDNSKSVSVEVPLRPITLDCPGVKAGGLLEQMVRKIKIRCPVSQIPDDIPVSLSSVGISETVYANQVPMPEGVTLLTPPRTALMSVLKTRAMKKAEAETPK